MRQLRLVGIGLLKQSFQSFALSDEIVEVLLDDQCQSLMAALNIGVVFNDHSVKVNDRMKLFNIERLRYENVILITEQDEAGNRLRNVLIQFFLTYMRPLVRAGHIFVLEYLLRPGFTQEEFGEIVINPVTRRLSVVVDGGNVPNSI
jgi:hypothetical protein